MSPRTAGHVGDPGAQDETQASAHAAARLRAEIADGALAPGAKLSEHTVAAELGISRNTLRECFAMLAAEGLVLRIPHRGVFVARPTADDVRDLYAARRILEPGAVLWGDVDDALTARLRGIVAAALAARETADVATMSDANQRFHRALVEAAASRALLSDMDRALARMRLVFHAMLADREFHARYAVRNAEVLAALESYDRDRAARLLRDSLGAARDEILDRLG